MTGIAELFAEYSGQDPDWFQLAFCFERTREAELERKRENEQRRWRIIRTNHERAEHRRVVNRRAVAKHEQKKRATDPQWVEAYRKRNRERMQRKRAERTAG